MYQQKKIIGSEEWIRIPELNIPAVKARIDSGAKTSTLHAYNMQTFEDNGKEYVRFDVHPVQHNRRISVRCKAELVGRRVIKSSSGDRQRRYVIKTPITLGGETWDIEVTLTNRDNMGYRMLIGREAMRGRYIVDPEQKFIFGNLSIDADKLYMITKRPRKSLRIAVLASNPELYSNRRIIEAGVTRGHEMIFVNIRQCYINVSSENPAVHYRGGETLHDIDAVIPRIRPSVTSYGCAVLRHFEHLGAYCLNDAISISRSRDKLRSLQLLVNKGIDIPITGFADSPEDTNDIVELVGGAPLIVKLLEGTQGKGVVLAQTDKAAESVINAFKSLKANILVQAFVKEAEGRDLRLFVVDGKVIGSMERVAAEGEFRANVHLGGKAREVKTSSAERKIAIKASKVMGLKVAGVDIIRSRSGPKVLEVNSSPGLEGIEGVTHKDIAGEMIDAIERHLL